MIGETMIHVVMVLDASSNTEMLTGETCCGIRMRPMLMDSLRGRISAEETTSLSGLCSKKSWILIAGPS